MCLFSWLKTVYQLHTHAWLRQRLGVLSFKARWRLRLRMYRHATLAYGWMQFALEQPLSRNRLGTSRHNAYRLLQKPLRPYLNRYHTPVKRCDALESHYRQMIQIPELTTLQGLRSLVQGWTLAEFIGKSQAHYVIHLACTDKFDREGEFLLTLEQRCAHHRIAAIAFSLNESAGGGLDIGCLQGAKAGDGPEFIRQVTKDFHSMRPKNLLMFALYDLAACWGIQHIRAISNEARIYSKQWRPFRHQDYAKANYDQFWEELGGQVLADTGWFQLPPHLHQKSIEDVPSKHRSEHRRRLALRDSIDQQIQASFAAARTETAAEPLQTSG